MFKRVAALLCLCVVSCAALQAEEIPNSGKVVVWLSEGHTASDAENIPGLKALFNAYGVDEIVPVFGRTGVAPRDPKLFEALGLDRFVRVGWRSKSSSLDTLNRIVADLKKQSVVKDVYIDGLGSVAYLPNDPELSNQWHHTTIGSTTAWDYARGSTSILIAVVDSGLCFSNADFNYANITAGYDYVEGDWDPNDEIGHGTHVAGLIGATGDNGFLVAGMAWESRLMIIRVINETNTCTWSDTAAGIQEAADAGADVINVSIQGQFGSLDLNAACTYAYGLDVAIVACMGNWNSCTVSYPAGYAETIAVGMTDTNDERYATANVCCPAPCFNGTGSNYGGHNDVVAPGRQIVSTHFTTSAIMSGTSMATPLVSGLAALFRQMRPDWDNEQVRDAIHVCAEDLVGDPAEDIAGFDEYMGYGRIRVGFGVETTAYSTNCPLSYSAAMMAASPMRMMRPYYRMRDRHLSKNMLGQRLVKDYYRVGPAIARFLQEDVELTFRLVNLALRVSPLIEAWEKNPAAGIAISRDLYNEALTLTQEINACLSSESREILVPWLDRAQQDPIGMLRDFGIRAVIAD